MIFTRHTICQMIFCDKDYIVLIAVIINFYFTIIVIYTVPCARCVVRIITMIIGDAVK